MKKIIGFVGGIVLLMAFVGACSDMNELSDRFLDRGATIYAPMVDSVNVYSGYNRIELEISVKTQRIDTLRIFRNDGEMQTELLIGNRPGRHRLMIENLPENEENLFRLVSADSYGNKSLPVEVTGTAYGPTYKQQAPVRRISLVDTEGSNGIIKWNAKTKDLVYTEVRYTTNSGEQETVRLLPEEEVLTCPDAKREVPFEYCSVFLPTAGIDTVTTEWITYTKAFPRDMVLCDKSGWAVIAASSEGGPYTKDKVIDNNYDVAGNFWHMDYGSQPAPPHWLIIDMQNPVEVCKIVTWRRNMGDTKTIEYYIGDDSAPDAAGWTKIASGDTWDNHVCSLLLDKPLLSGRYLKLVMPDSNRWPNTSITEIDVYKFE